MLRWFGDESEVSAARPLISGESPNAKAAAGVRGGEWRRLIRKRPPAYEEASGAASEINSEINRTPE